VDIVALQKGSQDGGNTSTNSFVFIGEALEEMVNQKCMDFDGVRNTDLHWRSIKRTALRNVKNLELLRKRIRLLIRLWEKVVKTHPGQKGLLFIPASAFIGSQVFGCPVAWFVVLRIPSHHVPQVAYFTLKWGH
jgi:hypothetical protein